MCMPDFGISDPELLDQIYDVVAKGACATAGIMELTGWRRTQMVDESVLEDFGASRSCHLYCV